MCQLQALSRCGLPSTHSLPVVSFLAIDCKRKLTRQGPAAGTCFASGSNYYQLSCLTDALTEPSPLIAELAAQYPWNDEPWVKEAEWEEEQARMRQAGEDGANIEIVEVPAPGRTKKQRNSRNVDIEVDVGEEREDL